MGLLKVLFCNEDIGVNERTDLRENRLATLTKPISYRGRQMRR